MGDRYLKTTSGFMAGEDFNTIGKYLYFLSSRGRVKSSESY